jgi:hypothetical protein
MNGRDGLVVLDGKLATHSKSNVASSKTVKTINWCHREVVLCDTRHLIALTITLLQFARLRNASTPNFMVLTSISITQHVNYLIVRKNSVVAGILEADYPSVNAAQFKSLVIIAVKKIRRVGIDIQIVNSIRLRSRSSASSDAPSCCR